MNACSIITAFVALFAVMACQRPSFESLGTVPTPAAPLEPSDAAPIWSERAVDDTGSQAGAGGSAAVLLGAAGSGGATAAGGRGAGDTTRMGGALTGSLGPNARFESVVSGHVIGWSAEFGTTTLYLIDHEVDCDTLSDVGWLAKLPSEVQVIEVMFLSGAMTGTMVASLVSHAHGGMYGFSKTAALSNVLALTRNSANGIVEGSLMAMWMSGVVNGSFRADFCASGMSF